MRNLIRDATRSRMIWFAAVSISIFIVIVLTVPFDYYMPFFQAARFTAAVSVVAAYLPGLMPAIRQPFDRVNQLILAIILSWSAEACLGMWGLIWRVSDQTWMITSPVLALLVYTKAISGSLYITAPGSFEGRVPRKNWVVLGTAGTIAVAIAAFIIGAQWGPVFFRP